MGTITDVAMHSAPVTHVKGRPARHRPGTTPGRGDDREPSQNLWFAFVYTALGVLRAASLLFSFTGGCCRR
jgi:cation transport ATPase